MFQKQILFTTRHLAACTQAVVILRSTRYIAIELNVLHLKSYEVQSNQCTRAVLMTSNRGQNFHLVVLSLQLFLSSSQLVFSSRQLVFSSCQLVIPSCHRVSSSSPRLSFSFGCAVFPTRGFIVSTCYLVIECHSLNSPCRFSRVIMACSLAL